MVGPAPARGCALDVDRPAVDLIDPVYFPRQMVSFLSWKIPEGF